VIDKQSDFFISYKQNDLISAFQADTVQHCRVTHIVCTLQALVTHIVDRYIWYICTQAAIKNKFKWITEG